MFSRKALSNTGRIDSGYSSLDSIHSPMALIHDGSGTDAGRTRIAETTWKSSGSDFDGDGAEISRYCRRRLLSCTNARYARYAPL